MECRLLGSDESFHSGNIQENQETVYISLVSAGDIDTYFAFLVFCFLDCKCALYPHLQQKQKQKNRLDSHKYILSKNSSFSFHNT